MEILDTDPEIGTYWGRSVILAQLDEEETFEAV
jgi:hypothetical protein